MKKFHVYAIGNALVDIDIEVSHNTLESFSIDKGVMTLIDEETHHRLLKELHGIKHVRACGGSAANTVHTLQQLGAKTFYSCKVGNDEAGHFYYKNLISHGIETNLHLNQEDGITGKCIVLVTPDADRTMNTFLGTTATFSITQLSEIALKNAEYLYIEGYLVASELGYEAAMTARKMALKHNIKTALSLSDPNMVTDFKQKIATLLNNRIDILFCNKKEALLFTNTTNLNDAKKSLTNYAKSFVITLGGDGALIYDGHDFMLLQAYQVSVLDTSGAGDIFAGAFLYGITQGLNYYDAGNLACFAASKVVSKFGPRLDRDHVKEILEVKSFTPLKKSA